jgi:hypothetical protein
MLLTGCTEEVDRRWVHGPWELMLDFDVVDAGLVELDTEKVVEDANKVTVLALISKDELIGEGEAWR